MESEAGYQYQGLAKMPGLGSIRGHTTPERLKYLKKSLEDKLTEVNKALALIEANPKVIELMEAIERAGG